MTVIRMLSRVALGGMLVFAGVSHLTVARQEFQAQVPKMVPLDPDTTVVASGVVEVALGSALVVAPRRWRRGIGWIAAGFFAAVFPGNIAQWLHQRDAFGLDTDEKRFVRLFFQPVLIGWALWSTRR
ncbi:MauE/DoxX family redox-associated membrane protein [Salinibacterium sp. ZJ70]|uniref:DoxX family protein n=1 Tax=Salinibacterium sp. ZJ70 TaxID=2708084 RepID=UPI00142314B5|nr:MauE/DoxX family redox-associated membrane protein [Salinibacterium sp. ZJ70]